MEKITTLLCNDLCRRAAAQRGIVLKITPSLKHHLVETYANAKMGARPLKRAVQTVIENPLAEKILAEGVPAGAVVTATCKGNDVVFTIK